MDGHLFEIDEDYTKPIIDILAAGKGRAMLEADEVGTWLYARHAIKRNAQIDAGLRSSSLEKLDDH